ncbi:benzoyl-CoA 2,3-epoxidase subunit BoxB [Archangium violaceum]|uniref:benzoyl-CoA 2,3-epoxidase subunit BoxB n=1 Tax=Archangium violaceum TaxID=83451 RepID=UPI00193C456D|nr:benzoyl-CoA 2,3-epoxidase subunit BoxB [Archangium violaceum]QRK13782.1 benzoyl-CoA 2,3-epoxidase subunit BoxB [Archangium violaceum]
MCNAYIPNNVDLASSPSVARALTHWQSRFKEWWMERGPADFQSHEVYLRTAVGVEPNGWAHYDYVRLPEYRWGIFLSQPERNRTIGFGDLRGQPVWQEPPEEQSAALRWLIATQGDAEPASVEQQRLLGRTCPSLYDLRNLLQVNVEEARHLWAMVYLLIRHFGAEGRNSAEELLARSSGSQEQPRILDAFNAPVEDWLHFFMYTTFTDRVGKMQLLAAAESAFDPLSRTAHFMAIEEAHHLFVGETGVARVLRRTAELMRRSPNGSARELGGIDLSVIQKYLNLWYSLTLDLFGSEISRKAAAVFSGGVKGRPREARFEDHDGTERPYRIESWDAETRTFRYQDVPMRSAMNEVLRELFIQDCERVVERWNRVLAEEGLSERVQLPSPRFNRHQGLLATGHFSPEGTPLTAEEWERRRAEWLPTPEERAAVRSVQARAVMARGEMANWIAPPTRGIQGKPLDFAYVRVEA